MENDLAYGEHYGLPNEVYHAARGLSSTTIKHGYKTLGHLKAVLDGRLKKKQGHHFDVGLVCHEVILENSFDGFAVGPNVDSKASKEWRDFKKEAPPGKKLLTAAEWAQVRDMHDAFHANHLASSMVKAAHAEVSYLVRDAQVPLDLKARTDLIMKGDGVRIIDYKTCESADYRDFSKAIANYDYDISAVHYIRVVEQALGQQVSDFIWIAQEKAPPYALRIYLASVDLLARAALRHDQKLREIAEAFEKNEWPGYEERITVIDTPAWAHHLDSDEDPIFKGLMQQNIEFTEFGSDVCRAQDIEEIFYNLKGRGDDQGVSKVL